MRRLFGVTVAAAVISTTAYADTLIRCQFPDPQHVGGFTPMTWMLSGGTFYQGRMKPEKDSPLAKLVVVSRNGNVVQADWSTTHSTPRLQINMTTGEATENLMDRGVRRGICIASDPEHSSSDDEN